MHSCAVLVISSNDQVERKMSDSATDYSSPEEDISSSSSDYDYDSSEESSPESDDENERDEVGELRGVDPYRFEPLDPGGGGGRDADDGNAEAAERQDRLGHTRST